MKSIFVYFCAHLPPTAVSSFDTCRQEIISCGQYPPVTGPKAGDLLGEQQLRVGGADERGIVLKPHEVQAVDLAGTVVIEGGGNPPPMHIGLRGVYGPGVSARSNEDGSFVLKDLLPGHYDMQIIPDTIVNGTVEPGSIAGASYPVSARLGENEVLQTGFDLDGPPASSLRITVGSHWIEIGGKVLDASGGSLPDRAFDRNAAAGLLDDAVDGRQAQPRAFPFAFGREKRFEDVGHDRGLDARSFVDDRQRDIKARDHFDGVRGIRVAEFGNGSADLHIAGSERNSSAFRHGIGGIQTQIQDDLLNAALVNVDVPEERIQDRRQSDVVSQQPLKQFIHPPDDMVD